jgi:O-antigen/teichoic acid export membrane protein
MDLRIVPHLRRYSGSFALFYRLFSFGGWVMISNLIIPIFVYLDRFLIGALLTMSAVAFYTVPYDIVTRLLIIPGSIAGVLFPTFSNLASNDDRNRINIILMRSIKYLLTVMMPFTVIFVVFSKDILMIWMGNDFAEESANVFRLLSIGILLNAIGYMPIALIQGIGRPDVVAKYHLVEFPIYVSVTFLLINHLGINGAALAWCLRMAWAIPIFTVLCARVAKVPLKSLSENGTNRSIIVAAGILIASIALSLQEEMGTAATGLLAGALLIGSIAFTWFITFDRIDKDFAKRFIMRVRNLHADRR